jgi:O-antigen/teichoic acid export membrane protein
MDLKHKSFKAFLWSATEVCARQGMQFIVTVILARLLAPEDFGLIAMLYVFSSIAILFVDSGFSSALIQRHDITAEDEATVFFFNLIASIGIAVVLFIAAPWIASFFHQPTLCSLTYLMAFNLIVGAFSSIHSTLLMKTLEFKVLMKVGVVASVLSGGVAIGLAWLRFGVWSLAWQIFTSSLVSAILLWRWHPWRPAWVFSVGSLRKLSQYGSFMLLSGFLDALYTRMYALLIGKFFSARELGYYSQGLATRQAPANVLETIFNRVAFPFFSSQATDKVVLRDGLRKVLMMAMFINIPTMLGLAVVANPLVILLLGEKWLPSVPVLQVLCLSGILWPLHTANLDALTAQGHSNLFFRIEIVKKVVAMTLTLGACRWGILAIAWMQMIIGIIAFFINAHYTKVFLKYGAQLQILDLAPCCVAGILMAAMLWYVEPTISGTQLVRLLQLVGMGMMFYLGMAWIFKFAALEMLIGGLRIFHDQEKT